VLEITYLIFNEGYAAAAGGDLIRPSLCLEAQRLGRVLAGLMPEDADVLGLLALMEIQASRLPARTGPRPRTADRAESCALGPAADPPRPGRTGPR
jgi:predicted RNA polymerase sigma factor